MNIAAPLVASNARSVLIIGDSIALFSSGLGLASALPEYTVTTRAVINYDFVQWTSRLDEAFSDAPAPSQIVIPLGTNDAFNYDGGTIVPFFLEFHKQLRLRTAARTIYFKMPRTRQSSIQGRVLAIGDAVNSHLPDNSGFVDLDTPFVQAGDPALLYPDIDPLHPNTKGIEIIAGAVRPAISAP